MRLLKTLVKRVISPARYHDARRRLRYAFLRTKFQGKARYCPLCETNLRCLLPWEANPPRPQAKCPVCGAMERHRFLWLVLTRHTDLFNPPRKHLLHIAAEEVLRARFLQHANLDYLTGDLLKGDAMVQVDVSKMQFEDNSFDAAICNHVLEHVPDDRAAMREFYRVLKPGGWAMLLVPIKRETTFEDPSVTTPEERARVFGQYDHVRIYGHDYVDRLREAGFTVKVYRYAETLQPDEIAKMGLEDVEDVFMCVKPRP